MLLLLVGLLLAVIAMPTKKNKGGTQTLSEGLLQTTEETKVQGEKQQMERDLQSLLETVEGVGKVQVMLTVQDTAGALYETSRTTPQVTGVLIAAEGADNLLVVRNIQEAVEALFQVEAHKIKVMKMK